MVWGTEALNKPLLNRKERSCLFYLWCTEFYLPVSSFSFLAIQPSSVIVPNYWMTSQQLFARKNAAMLTEPITLRCTKPDTISAAIWSILLCNNKTRLSCIKNLRQLRLFAMNQSTNRVQRSTRNRILRKDNVWHLAGTGDGRMENLKEHGTICVSKPDNEICK
jgi:hypothetical protein